ncbi:MAG: alginate lyase family protein [Bacteroidales bacterium]|nr:alginate lyase family protein [Bacteroidales bacterium]
MTDAAELYLLEEPVTVTSFHCDRSMGGIHDFYSEGDYWWPDPENPEGPYIRRDGLTNPNNFVAHRKAMRNMSIWVPTLVAAYKITGEEKYAAHAVRHLKAWFSDKETMMSPNLLYAQAIKGIVTGRGIGIIDTLHLTEVAKAIEVLTQLGYLSGSDLSGIKEWFVSYLDWMTTHEFGIAERDNGNNHSTCWTVQVGAFASLVDDQKQLAFCRDFYRNTLLPGQMAKDGSFPRELGRTKPYGYSLFNLEAMAMVCQILSVPEDQLWTYESEDSLSIGLGIAYMYPFMKDKSSWPLDPDVMYFEDWPVRHPFLLFGGLALGHPEYIELWKTLEPDPTVEEVLRNFWIRQPVLWVD